MQTQTHTLRILIADDHSVVREGLKMLLTHDYEDILIGEAENAKEIYAKISGQTWDLIIMDINMPGRDGLEVLEQFKEEKLQTPVLILSMHPEEHMALRAFKAGAYGYLTKSSAGEDLIHAVKRILSGKKYITPSIAERFVDVMDNSTDKKPHELLSNREFQTTMLLATGKTVSQIAEQLSLSIPTISTYRNRTLEK